LALLVWRPVLLTECGNLRPFRGAGGFGHCFFGFSDFWRFLVRRGVLATVFSAFRLSVRRAGDTGPAPASGGLCRGGPLSARRERRTTGQSSDSLTPGRNRTAGRCRGLRSAHYSPRGRVKARNCATRGPAPAARDGPRRPRF
jgi:hypothetical protein